MTPFKSRISSWLTEHRGLVIVGACLPMSQAFGALFRLRQAWQQLTASPKRHTQRVEAIQSQVREWREAPAASRRPMCTDRPSWINLSTRFVNKRVLHRIRLGGLHNILEIDTVRGIVRAESLVTVGQVTRALARRGYMLAVTLEVEDATLGGLAMAVGMTTYSHKVGLYQETVEAYEMVLGDGSWVRATAEENADLFRALPWSHGTLGFLTALELKIIPCKPYVRLKYTPMRSQAEYCEAIRRLSMAEDPPDFVEATIFSRDEAVVMEGRFADAALPEERARVNRAGLWFKPWFFKHVEGMLGGEAREEWVPLRDYLHRHSRAIFWTLQDMIPFGNHPVFRALVGWACPPRIQFLKLTTTRGIRELTFTKQVFQDIVLPMNALERSIDLSEELFDVYPLLVYPCAIYDHGEAQGQLRAPRPESLVSGETDRGMYYDLGIYGVPGPVKRGEFYDPVEAMRAMEAFTREVGGYPFLYADTFMNEEEFEAMFDLTLYNQVRVKYAAEGAFPTLFEKTRPEVDVFEIGQRAAEASRREAGLEDDEAATIGAAAALSGS